MARGCHRACEALETFVLSSAVGDAVQHNPGRVVVRAAFAAIDAGRQLFALTMKSRFGDVDDVRAGTEVLSQEPECAHSGLATLSRLLPS